MKLITYCPIALLPSPQDYLRVKRNNYLNILKEVRDKVENLTCQITELNYIADGIKIKYTKVDRELAEIDGRLKKEAELRKARKSKTKPSTKFTAEQVASIAAALGINMEEV